MPRVVPNSFTRIEFTDEEEKEAMIVPPLFRLYLVNLRGQVAEGKIRLKYDPEHPLLFLQQEASLQGQLDLLDQLISDE